MPVKSIAIDTTLGATASAALSERMNTSVMDKQPYPESTAAFELRMVEDDEDEYGTPEGTPYDMDEELAWIAESEPELGD